MAYGFVESDPIAAYEDWRGGVEAVKVALSKRVSQKRMRAGPNGGHSKQGHSRW